MDFRSILDQFSNIVLRFVLDYNHTAFFIFQEFAALSGIFSSEIVAEIHGYYFA